MKLHYTLIIKGDEEQAAATLEARTNLPEYEIDEITNYGYCQTQVSLRFEVADEYAYHTLDGNLNFWLNDSRDTPYPLGSLLYWSSGIRSTQGLAQARGLKVFDTALPQGWCDQVREKLGDPHLWLMGNIVWSYDAPSVWGEPKAVTKMGDEILARLG